MTAGHLNIDQIRTATGHSHIGQRIEYKAETSSTNDEAWLYADTDSFDGLVVFADAQTAGRGRRGRIWQSHRGASLLLSVGISGHENPLAGDWLSIITVIAVHETISRFCDTRPTIKWPNDVLADGRKLSGILIESRQNQSGARVHVLGIGINCLQHQGHFDGPLATSATSLELLSRHPIDRTAVAIHLLHALDQRLACPESLNQQTLRNDWLAKADALGARVTLEHNGQQHSGTIVDLDPTAALVLQLDEGGIRAFNAADTSLVSMEYGS